MGTGFQGPFKELWDFVSTIFAECQETGKSVAVENQMLPIERHGFVEETFYTVRNMHLIFLICFYIFFVFYVYHIH